MADPNHHLVLADDDIDDCIFFREALEELPLTFKFTSVNDGVELMKWLLENAGPLPDMLFLDLNMPLKTGFECLSEIKTHKQLKHLPVIIFSTSYDEEMVNLLFENGAHYYIRKPSEFAKLKKSIHQAILLVTNSKKNQPKRENFVLYGG